MDDVEELIRLLRERDGQDFDGEVHLTSAEAERLTKALTVSPADLDKAARAICCPSGVCANQEKTFAVCQAHTYRGDARAAATAFGLRLSEGVVG